MDTKWFECEPNVRGIVATCVGHNVQLIHDCDSLSWSTELVDTLAETEKLTVIIDLSAMDCISYIAILALANLESLLTERSGRLEIRGARPWVLGAIMAIEPTLDASSEMVTDAQTVPNITHPKHLAA